MIYHTPINRPIITEIRLNLRPLDDQYNQIERRNYVGNLVLTDGKVSMVRFDGGYFDGEGKVHYFLTDYQGNVVRTLGYDGAVEQTAGYYPDGEPWREPEEGNPYLFGGKERVTLGGLGMSDFGPDVNIILHIQAIRERVLLGGRHGMKKYNDDATHYLAYISVLTSPFWIDTTEKYKQFNREKLQKYMKKAGLSKLQQLIYLQYE